MQTKLKKVTVTLTQLSLPLPPSLSNPSDPFAPSSLKKLPPALTPSSHHVNRYLT